MPNGTSEGERRTAFFPLSFSLGAFEQASTLLKENDSIHKCVFVVDREPLDRPTREDWSRSDKTLSKGRARRVSACSANELKRFQEGCVEENTHTAALVHRPLLEDYADKVIVTTIQRLGLVFDRSNTDKCKAA